MTRHTPQSGDFIMSDSDRFLLKQIIEQEKASSAPRAKDSDFFEQFASGQILKDRDFDLDPEQISSGLVGGANDGGVDSIYLFANGRLVREDADIGAFKDQQIVIDLIVIQAKYANSFSETAVQKMTDFTENCLQLSNSTAATNKKLYSESLLAAFKELYKTVLVKRPVLTIAFYVASLGEDVHEKVEVRKQKLVKKCQDLYSAAKVSFGFVGAKALFTLYHQAPTKTIPLHTSKYIASSAFGPAYICLVPLQKFFEFISEKGIMRGHIFEANVRDYQGDVTVNEQIAVTLSVPRSEEFWWLNNGITVIASEIEGSGEIISVTDPLIVNGLQTSHEIFYHYKGVINASSGDERTILVRLIETSDPQSIDRIITATNSQTKIPKIWLHATEEIHRKIETALLGAGLYYDRRKNHYQRQGKPITKIVTLPYLAQAVASIILQRPDDARARPTSIADQHYDEMFSDRFPIEMYPKCAVILKLVDDFLDGMAPSRSEKNNVMFHMAMYAACVATSSVRPKREQIAALNTATLTDSVLNKCFDAVGGIYFKLGAGDITAKGPQFVGAVKESLADQFKGRKSS